MNSDLTLRPATPQDWPAIQRGFAHSFLDHRSPSLWRWRYRCDDQGRGPWRGSVAVAPDGSVAAFAGGLEGTAWIDAREHPVMLMRDTYTHPRWRGVGGGARRGLLVQTELHFHAHCAAEFAATYGIGQARRVRLAQLAGVCIEPSPLQWLELRIDPAAQALGTGCIVRPAEFNHPMWDAAWQTRRRTLHAGLVKDRQYLSWRFDARQGVRYETLGIHSLAADDPLGFIVLRAVSPTDAFIADLALPRDAVLAQHALAQCVAALARRGVRNLKAVLAGPAQEAAALRAHGFEPSAPVEPVQVAWRTHPAAQFSADTPARFVFTPGDSDIY